MGRRVRVAELVDAHAHFPPKFLPGQIELFSFLFLRHGITGVRVPGDVNPGASLYARAEIDAGGFAGPRVKTCGRFVDGVGSVFASALVVTNPEEAKAVVGELAAAGVDCIKVYNELDAVSLQAIGEAAHAHGLPVIGHVPWRLTFEEAQIDDVQHMLGFFRTDGPPGFASSGGWKDVTDERIEEVIAAALRNETAMTTTLVAGQRIARGREIATDPNDPMRIWLPPWYARAFWAVDGGITPANRMADEDFERVHQANERMRPVVRRLYDAGVTLRAGTDTFAPLLVPGASLHEELQLYVRGGLTPEEALQIATRGSADALGVPGLGTLRVGAPADFAVYRDDPTQDLAALDTLLAVVQDGRLYTRETLDAQQAAYQASYDGFFQQRVMSRLVRASLGLMMRNATEPSTEPEE